MKKMEVGLMSSNDGSRLVETSVAQNGGSATTTTPEPTGRLNAKIPDRSSVRDFRWLTRDNK